MKRKDKIREAMQAGRTPEVFLTDKEHTILAKYGTTYKRYIEGEQPQVFTIIANTPQEKQQADELGMVLSKLDKITGNHDKVNVVVFEKHRTDNQSLKK